MKKLLFTFVWIALLLVGVQPLQAIPTYTKSTTVRLVIQPYCRIDIKESLITKVPEPGQIPENGVVITISSNFKHDISVTWKLPENWPQEITTHDSISGSFPEGTHEGKIWLEGTTTLQNSAGTYSGTVVITVAPAS